MTNESTSYPPPQPGVSATYRSTPPTAKGPRRLGVVAFALAVAGVVLGTILVFVGGLQMGTGLSKAEITPGTTVDPSAVPADAASLVAAGGILVFLGWAIFAILGLWGFIQGIVATVKNRGRGWGIAAIIIPVVGVGILSVFSGVGLAVGAATLIGGS
jgi:hypothetical protein